MEPLTKEERERYQTMGEATKGTWYRVYYYHNPADASNQPIRSNFKDNYHICNENLKVFDINGFGIGYVYFTNKDNRLVMLPWSMIVCMIPIKGEN